MEKRSNGFTLVELVIVIAILGIVGGLMSRLMFFSANQNSRISQEIEATQDANLTVQYVVAEVHRHDAAGRIQFVTVDSTAYLQIYDPDTAFIIENNPYSYQWMRITNQQIDDEWCDVLEVAFGTSSNDYENSSTTWYPIVESKYIEDIVFDKQTTQNIDGVDVLKYFDVSVRYRVSASLTETIVTTILLRSDI
ncbi:prepilin-type N-terminal cleavage/methylation domain-containing protein [Fusibacter paucivorans]|uniref:Prepilin-type N-terminal cleavage/methylation domain-containing protein n=1 Tax=Fusibacter paucivorans TaxID=76009 RepID=A0ABS5PU47_9FIRM|nr:prepilin-type N-terminal cleavage/methylation domain-containing protein [Fusibacter paucivorans]